MFAKDLAKKTSQVQSNDIFTDLKQQQTKRSNPFVQAGANNKQ